MEIRLIDNGSKLDQMSNKILHEYLRFCSSTHPINANIEVILLNNNVKKFNNHQGLTQIKILTYEQTLSQIIEQLSTHWVNLFAKRRKIQTNGEEPKIMYEVFRKKNPTYLNHL